MAINFIYLQMLKQAIDLARQSGDPMVKAACLSYPDLVVSKVDLERYFGTDVVAHFAVRPDSDELREHYHLVPHFGPVFATESLLAAFGLEPVFFDIAQLRGIEQIL